MTKNDTHELNQATGRCPLDQQKELAHCREVREALEGDEAVCLTVHRCVFHSTQIFLTKNLCSHAIQPSEVR